MVSRRGFLKSGGLALLGVGLLGGIPGFLAEAAASEKILSPYKRKKRWYVSFSGGLWMA
ncbi:hypothetical protein ACFJIV_26265 [Mucilaginibacter sp. UC70_90]